MAEFLGFRVSGLGGLGSLGSLGRSLVGIWASARFFEGMRLGKAAGLRFRLGKVLATRGFREMMGGLGSCVYPWAPK